MWRERGRHASAAVARREQPYKRWLLRRLAVLCGVLCLLAAASRLYLAATSKSPTENWDVMSEVNALDYLQWSTHNSSLDRRVNGSVLAPVAPTALELRVDAVVRRRWAHTAGGVAAANRARPVRVRVATVSNRIDASLCAAQASALASGVNVSVVGFGESYSHVTRLQTYRAFVETEGLTDEDVVMFVDSDVLWTGSGLDEAVAKFVAYSPATQASLWPAAVRAWEDYGEHIGERFLQKLTGKRSSGSSPALLQLPPIIFGAERYCNWMQHLLRTPMCDMSFALVDYITELARNGDSALTGDAMARFLPVDSGMAAHALSSVRTFYAALRGASSSPSRTRSDPFFFHSNALGQRNVVRYLNGGGVLMRVWALRVYAAVFDEFIRTEEPMPSFGRDNNGWYCDQSVHGPLYTRGRMFEAAHGMLEAAPSAEAQKAMETGPHGLPPGMVGLDRRSEFLLNAAGVLLRLDRNYVGTAYYSRYAGHLVFRLWWYLRRLRTWWLPWSSLTAVRHNAAMSASGCALSPQLLRRPPSLEEVERGYQVLRDDDADVAAPPVVHIPGNDKDEKYAKIFRYMPWRVAARWSRTANETLFRVLRGSEVEVCSSTHRHRIPFMKLCPVLPYLT